MARYINILPQVDYPDQTYTKIQQYLFGKGYKTATVGGQQAFKKGDGFWTAARYVKITYYDGNVRVEAWVDSMGSEMGLDGFYGWAVKKPLKEDVKIIEMTLMLPGNGFTPAVQSSTQSAPNAYAAQSVYSAQPANSYGDSRLPAGITKKEYFKKYADDGFYTNVKVAAIIAYICVAINLVVSVLLSPIGIIESLVFLGLTLGMQLGKSKGCAIGMLVMAIVQVVLTLILSGSFGGWMWLIAGITAVSAFATAEKRFKQQQMQGW